ncbi:MAG: phosphoribosylformylglycinamidine synthase subunit PurL [Candidatus Omnitrophota bacterium]
MLYKIKIKDKPGLFDAIGEGVKKDIKDLGVETITSVKFAQVYFIEGEVLKPDVERICAELLCDPVTQLYEIEPLEAKGAQNKTTGQGLAVIEVAYNPGVMDPWEESIIKGIKDLGIEKPLKVKTAKEYIIEGSPAKEELDMICEKLLLNKVIQHAVCEKEETLPNPEYKFNPIEVAMLNADDEGLSAISREGQLFLNVTEMRQIKNYFKSLSRNPTDCELETIAQTWSEHCGHKTFRGKIEYTENGNSQVIDNLLKQTIMKATKELDKPWCVSVFKDNSGVIEFDDNYNICFKVETHNHPSALEPYGGANTGIGGVIRDPMGTGLGAKPIFNTDVFCFGLPDTKAKDVPPGVLHPKRVMKGVVAGVRDYGNKMGIPTVNGAVLFDESYTGNPLVYCGTVGIMPRDKSFKKVEPGNLVVLVGGRTGRDGIHGATFSSGALTMESEKISASAVQIGNPITEKKMLDTLLRARDMNLYCAITDCGGGGLSSAVGEMGAECGVKVDLEKVPLKYKGLSYTEIWISEAQERMILAVPKENLKAILEIFANEDVEATCIGEFTLDKRLKLYYAGKLVCDMDMDFLHNGLPELTRKALWAPKRREEPDVPLQADLTDKLLRILSHYNVCSKEWIVRQYDHEVQGRTVIKPLLGARNDGPSDAAVMLGRLGSNKGVIVSCGINSRYGLIDPYWMAASCIDEALRQIIAVGGNLNRVALLDNFCWGNTNKPQQLGSLVRAAKACYDFAIKFGTPFISGKDSLNNEYEIAGESVSIAPTLLISAMAVMEDVRNAVTMDAKSPGNLIYVVGKTYNELGGSIYWSLFNNSLGNSVPKVRPAEAVPLMKKLSDALAKRLVRSCHDLSEGGIAAACAEMAFAGEVGMTLALKDVPREEGISRDDIILFSESNSRFIVEIHEKDREKFEEIMQGVCIAKIGKTVPAPRFEVSGLDGKTVISSEINTLKEAWQKPLRW